MLDEEDKTTLLEDALGEDDDDADDEDDHMADEDDTNSDGDDDGDDDGRDGRHREATALPVHDRLTVKRKRPFMARINS
jgi:hypothetical protein